MGKDTDEVVEGVREACPEDFEEIIEILNEHILGSVASFRMQPLVGDAAADWFNDHRDRRYPIFVAPWQSMAEPTVGKDGESQPRLAAWASLSRWSTYEAYDATAEVSVWVRGTAQRRGWGRRLMTKLVQHARGQNLRVLLSRIEAENEASLQLHRKFGFETIGTMHRVGEKFGRLLDVVMMELQLECPRGR